MIDRMTRVILRSPRAVLGAATLILVLAGIFGATAAQHLLSGGYNDSSSESARAEQLLDEVFDRGGVQVVVKLDAPGGTDATTDPRVRDVGAGIVDDLSSTESVRPQIISYWNNPALAPALVSRDKSSTLIIANMRGTDDEGREAAALLDERYTGERQGISVRVGGQGIVFHQVNEQTSRDLAIAEAIAIPITFVVLIVVFGGLVAAAVPVAIGIIAIIGTLALLRLIATVTDVSIFAMNLTTAMGLALAIDYSLLIVTRYREEVSRGTSRPDAIRITMSTAGRTVAFSAVTVALSLAALVVFPMYFLRSFAYAGVGVVIVAAIASLVLTPALLMVLGDRIDSLDVRRAVRRLLKRPEPVARPIEDTRWYRLVQFVLRRALPIAVVVSALLLVLGAPFLGIRFGFPDDRVLPTSASSHEIQQEIRDDFDRSLTSVVTVLVQGETGGPAIRGYATELSRVADVDSVSSSAGIFTDGRQIGPGDPGDTRDGVSVISVSTTVDAMSEQGGRQLDDLRSVAAPAGAATMFTGLAATNSDAVAAIYSHLPWVLLIIGVATFILLFLFTGSVILPLKALVLNVLSLSATFGAMVWIFQDGNLGALGTTPTGYLVSTMPVLMFCIAFGLSMDYEVFLLGRIREEWLSSDRSRKASDHAVAVGIARTGRVVTAAALLMSIVFAGIAASGVSFMRMFGVGLALAVLMDATLIRLLLVPAFMRLAGRLNWWAPGPLRRLHDRIGLSEGGPVADVTREQESDDERDETQPVTTRLG